MAAFHNESHAELPQPEPGPRAYEHHYALLKVNETRTMADIVTIVRVTVSEEDDTNADNPNYHRAAAVRAAIDGHGLVNGDYIVVPLGGDNDRYTVGTTVSKSWND